MTHFYSVVQSTIIGSFARGVHITSHRFTVSGKSNRRYSFLPCDITDDIVLVSKLVTCFAFQNIIPSFFDIDIPSDPKTSFLNGTNCLKPIGR